MVDTSSSIPWNTPALWQEANASLANALRKNKATMSAPHNYASQIRHLLEQIFPLMDRLCQKTCHPCRDICCRRAWVWADFKDLLFLHLVGIPVPDRQLLIRQGEICRYAGPDGCRLERIQRPFVCVWYLCPEQTRLLNRQLAEKEHLSASLEQIKRYRRQMETAFIRATRGRSPL